MNDVILDKYTGVLLHLKAVRSQLAETQARLDEYTYKLAVAKARAERRAIEERSAGGKKPLGNNAEDRNREIVLILSEDVDYNGSREAHHNIQQNVSILKSEKESYEDELKLISLESDIHLREAIKELITVFTVAVSGTVATSLVGKETMNINGIKNR